MELKLDRLKVPIYFLVLTVLLLAVAVLCQTQWVTAADTPDQAVIEETVNPEVHVTAG